MTRNQLRAIALAHELKLGATDPSTIHDHDWNLLLLAAGLNKVSAPPRVIVKRVLDCANRQSDYFADSHRSALR
jgi:hypothetical protein